MGDNANTVTFEGLLTEIKQLRDKVQEQRNEDREKIEEMVKEVVADAIKSIPKSRTAGFDGDNGGGFAEGGVRTVKNLLMKKALTNEVREIQRMADDLYIMSQVTGMPAKSFSMWGEYDSALRKALGTDEVGEGAEWVPTGFSAQLIEEVKLALRVAALHSRITMPQDPYKVPGRKTTATARLVGESQDIATPSSAGSREVILSAKKLMTWIPFPYELDEDAIIPILPLVREDTVTALAEAQETATINGDTSVTHQDSDVVDADDARKAWKGYRKLFTGTPVDLATFNVQALRNIRTAMGKYGVNPNMLVWVVSVNGYMKMLGLPEVMTLDKYGSNATLITGELGRLDGIPIIPSEFVRDDLNATGAYDGVTTDKTMIALVRRDGFMYGDKRSVMIESQRNIKGQTIDVVSSQRLDFVQRFAATEPVVGLGVNLATV